ncbi:ABC transporter substrate-binding protein [Paenibacillus radicis (ex Gao et al. 2016)]|uniref:ABC transporter substrate-binding protein n=1 Tax=Paenibacillus radicis (ex Gao et al. 2016) TaxID=1737354 RepID=A0A917LRV6_9BACL|nr:ABC transporter substrate-binding protein [Paenibacillus radicis (ex Gao et al. 2016)]GGG51989.1 ABC transporter substrate-binding protein [Paenibacillus radicis (ex Gao et al. 2016)]
MLKRSKKAIPVVLAGILSLSILLSGCGNANNKGGSSSTPEATNTTEQTTSSPEKLENVDLTWYFNGTPQADVASVEKAINEYLKDKLNVNIHLKATDWGNFDQKMQVLNASGENYDLAFTANWANNYYQNVNKGAFLPLDDLIAKYAPDIMQVMPAGGWEAAKVNGKIYAVPNYQIWAKTDVLWPMKEMADKYGLDAANVKGWEDLTPFLEKVKAGEPNLIPIESNKTGQFGNVITHYRFDEFAGRNVPGVVKYDDASLKVLNQFESPEYKSFVALMKEWNDKGFFRKDAATLADSTPDRKAAKLAVIVGGTVKPGGDTEMKALTGKDTLMLGTSESVLTTSGIIATMTAISKTSKNPERAMMLLNLLYKDTTLYNLIAHGIEGKHYKKIDNQTIEAIKDGGYEPNSDWEFGNQFNGYYRAGQKAGDWEETIKINERAVNSVLLGFSFDPTPVKTEVAQIATVTAQYVPLLETGAVDPEKFLPEFISKLKKAGSDKVIQEEQKQIDAWKASK